MIASRALPGAGGLPDLTARHRGLLYATLRLARIVAVIAPDPPLRDQIFEVVIDLEALMLDPTAKERP
jgi:hypothetical protein